MPYYMMQFSYTKEAVANLLQNPQDRTEVVRPAFEELLGSPSTVPGLNSESTTSS